VVAAQARPTDLIVITPVWCTSPFNYYCTLGNPQCTYPQEECRGAIHYNDLRARLLAPEPMATARARLAQAHREGRRVWLVMESANLSDEVPGGDRLPESVRLPTYAHVHNVRVNQLREQLNTLYGTPSKIALPFEGGKGMEVLQVWLYGSDDPSPRTAEEHGRSRSGLAGK
jgi:hypothetical protein